MAAAASFTSFTITQSFLGAALQFQPALGSKELEELIDAYVIGPASRRDKLSQVTMEFYKHATVDLNTGALVRQYSVPLSPWVSHTFDESPTQSQSSSFSPPIFTPSPGSFANLADSGYGSISMTPPTHARRARVSKKPKKDTKKAAEVRLPGFSILTKDGIDVTSSAGRGTKTKEQRDHAHLMRIMKACDECKRKKVRCDPSHRRQHTEMSRTSTSTTKSSSSRNFDPSPTVSVPSLSHEMTWDSQDSMSPFGTTAIDDFVLFPEDTSFWDSVDMSATEFDSQDCDLNQFSFDINDVDLNNLPTVSIDHAFDFSSYEQSSFQHSRSSGYNTYVEDPYGLDECAEPRGHISDSSPVHSRPHASTASQDSGQLDSSWFEKEFLARDEPTSLRWINGIQTTQSPVSPGSSSGLQTSDSSESPGSSSESQASSSSVSPVSSGRILSSGIETNASFSLPQWSRGNESTRSPISPQPPSWTQATGSPMSSLSSSVLQAQSVPVSFGTSTSTGHSQLDIPTLAQRLFASETTSPSVEWSLESRLLATESSSSLRSSSKQQATDPTVSAKTNTKTNNWYLDGHQIAKGSYLPQEPSSPSSQWSFLRGTLQGTDSKISTRTRTSAENYCPDGPQLTHCSTLGRAPSSPVLDWSLLESRFQTTASASNASERMNMFAQNCRPQNARGSSLVLKASSPALDWSPLEQRFQAITSNVSIWTTTSADSCHHDGQQLAECSFERQTTTDRTLSGYTGMSSVLSRIRPGMVSTSELFLVPLMACLTSFLLITWTFGWSVQLLSIIQESCSNYIGNDPFVATAKLLLCCVPVAQSPAILASSILSSLALTTSASLIKKSTVYNGVIRSPPNGNTATSKPFRGWRAASLLGMVIELS